MGTVRDWQGQAFNQDPESPNEIHGDELAQAYGFKGGLVPGVTVSAYLAHPAVEAWGMEFLERGFLHVRVDSPLYDGDDFTVVIEDREATGYSAALLRSDGTRCATARASIPTRCEPAPQRRGDPLKPADRLLLEPTRKSCEQLQAQGCVATRYHWHTGHLMYSYLRDRSAMPALLSGDSACANMSFILYTSNWAAGGNLALNPWLHLETSSQNYRAIAIDTRLVAEMAITDLFEKKGHSFFDARINLFDESDDACVAAIDLRAIYRLRDPGGK